MSPKARDDAAWWALVLTLNWVACWLMDIPCWLLPAAWLFYVALCFLVERAGR